jgi:hypothetical protein
MCDYEVKKSQGVRFSSKLTLVHLLSHLDGEEHPKKCKIQAYKKARRVKNPIILLFTTNFEVQKVCLGKHTIT